jgi:hypothetical protein
MVLVIADAGPLIGLARIGQLGLLPVLFRGVCITEPIAAEFGVTSQRGGAPPYPGSEALGLALSEGWLRVRAARSEGPGAGFRPVNPGVDASEASAIALALERQAAGEKVLLLVDDRCGRAEARLHGLAILGTAAVLVLAKERNLVAACAPLLQSLREQGYYLSDALVAAILNQVAEL